MVGRRWVVFIPQRRKKDIQKLPKADAKAVREGISKLQADPFHSGDISSLIVSDRYRLRIGAYRIKFRLLQEEHIVLIEAVERRSSTTYRRK